MLHVYMHPNAYGYAYRIWMHIKTNAYWDLWGVIFDERVLQLQRQLYSELFSNYLVNVSIGRKYDLLVLWGAIMAMFDSKLRYLRYFVHL